MPLVIALDFDGVLHNEHNVAPGYKMGTPITGALAAVELLKQQGHELVIYSCRGNEPRSLRAMQDWLKYFRFPAMRVAIGKPNADYYIDDRAIKFIDWAQVIGELDA